MTVLLFIGKAKNLCLTFLLKLFKAFSNQCHPCQWMISKTLFAACLDFSFEESNIWGDVMSIFLVNELLFGLIDSQGD